MNPSKQRDQQRGKSLAEPTTQSLEGITQALGFSVRSQAFSPVQWKTGRGMWGGQALLDCPERCLLTLYMCVCVHVHVCVLVCEDKSGRTRHEGTHQLLF